MLKIYSDKNYEQLNYICHMLIPFWGKLDDPKCPDNERFNKYAIDGLRFFEIVEDYTEADIIIYPAHITNDFKKFEEFQKKFPGKKVVTFFNDDMDSNINCEPNTYIFRTSFYKSKQKKNEFSLAAFNNDYGQMPIKKWEEKPTISFCGQNIKPFIREQCLCLLEKNNLVKTNFIRRNKFWAGWLDNRDINYANKVRKEYIDNICVGDYGLCVRGGGNFSYRLYEIMTCGRIPILINTDCVLPYDFITNYNELFPIVDVSNIKNIVDVLLNFHYNIKDNFEEHQIKIRKFWEEYLSPSGFFKNFNRHFND